MPALEGKVAVLTGAAQGIGKAIADRYAAEGATVVTSDLPGRGCDVDCDVTSEEQVQALIAGVVEQHGRLDVAVANAGIAHVAPLVGQTLDDWRRVTAVNLDGVFLTLTLAGAQMAQQGGGSLVSIASVSSQAGSALIGSYAAAKAGVVNLSKTLAVELRPHGVRSNAICPGFIDTELVQANKQTFETVLELPMSFDELIASRQGRYGTPEEVASLATFLAGDKSLWCTGSSYTLDGGLRASLL